MEVAGEPYTAVGGVSEIPVSDIAGALMLCGLDAIGPNPPALLEIVAGDVVVCLQTDEELARRYPDYGAWLADPAPYEVIRLPTDDHLAAADDDVEALILDLHSRLVAGDRVVVHCGAGWGRAGVVAVLLMCRSGARVDDALRDLRAARPAAGPQSTDQDQQIIRIASALRHPSP